MALKETVNKMKNLLIEIHHDLEKANRSNKAAAQRVRTKSIQFAKTAKLYRKESVAEAKARKRAAKKLKRK